MVIVGNDDDMLSWNDERAAEFAIFLKRKKEEK